MRLIYTIAIAGMLVGTVAPVKADCSSGICSLVPNGPSTGTTTIHPTPPTVTPGQPGAGYLAIPTGNSNATATGTGYGYGAATNEQRNNSASYSTGGDINNVIVNPATATPSVNTISASQVSCQGPMFTTGVNYIPNTNNDSYFNGGSNLLNNIQLSANITIPFGGASGDCKAISTLIQQQKEIDTSAGILNLCVKTMDQGIDLTRLDPRFFPWAKMCSSVFKREDVPAVVLPNLTPVPEPKQEPKQEPVNKVVRARG